ncbi:hypothetical protein [Cupriavidus consociatus]|uniref:hypothetical protein n=1 Tax=Cupriavidus consociatus TaxID=2821357 RepID=UPI001AE83DC0|nr:MULTISPECIES: hypothetical protein [unclassified Cupriavidus]MBP0624147.1 hypothetical protein [Cupriavidus sp. LEh25]MDK2660862.1 hypothetical protein [Cupriavidus sp. LEh21]
MTVHGERLPTPPGNHAVAGNSRHAGTPSPKLSNHSRIASATTLRSQVAASGTGFDEIFGVKASFHPSRQILFLVACILAFGLLYVAWSL